MKSDSARDELALRAATAARKTRPNGVESSARREKGATIAIAFALLEQTRIYEKRAKLPVVVNGTATRVADQRIENTI
jgi:hypothetical protein